MEHQLQQQPEAEMPPTLAQHLKRSTKHHEAWYVCHNPNSGHKLASPSHHPVQGENHIISYLPGPARGSKIHMVIPMQNLQKKKKKAINCTLGGRRGGTLRHWAPRKHRPISNQ